MTRKQIAIDFLRAVATGDVHAAFARWTAPGFVHHNPWFEATAEALERGMAEAAAANPATRIETIQALQEGDRVAVHSRLNHGDGQADYATCHWFRFDADDRIAEFWDIFIQAPADSPNRLGLF